MLRDYPIHTFTPEKPELAVNLNTGMKLTITKFISNNEISFALTPSLGFQVQIGNNKPYPIRSFVSLISAIQKDPNVLEFKLPFQIEESCKAHIKITDQGQQYDYSISMEYIIEPL